MRVVSVMIAPTLDCLYGRAATMPRAMAGHGDEAGGTGSVIASNMHKKLCYQLAETPPQGRLYVHGNYKRAPTELIALVTSNVEMP